MNSQLSLFPADGFDPERPLALIACGDRNWDDGLFVDRALDYLAQNHRLQVLIEGDARGADRAAHLWAQRFGGLYYMFSHRCYPADWTRHGRAAGPIRNEQMRDALLSYRDTHNLLVLAFHDSIATSRGTAHMVRSASLAGVPTHVLRHAR